MTILAIISSTLLVISLSTNIYLIFRTKSQTSVKNQSMELQEFCADLFSGKLGMIAVSRVNTDDLLLKSPRQR